MPAEDPRFIYITTSNRDEAIRIGKQIVRERLAACANVIDSMTSCYWWDGEVQEDTEAVLILKTTSDRVHAIVDQVKSLHSYDVPCVVSLKIEGGNRDYLEWIATETVRRG